MTSMKREDTRCTLLLCRTNLHSSLRKGVDLLLLMLLLLCVCVLQVCVSCYMCYKASFRASMHFGGMLSNVNMILCQMEILNQVLHFAFLLDHSETKTN